MRSALVLALLGGLYACFVAGACAARFEGEDELIDRGEANTPASGRDGGGRSSSSSGALPPRDSGAEPPTEAGADTGAPPEGPCDPTHGVGPLAPMPGLVNQSDYRTGARLTPDELHAAFLQVRNPADNQSPYDAYVASRATRNEPFGAPQKVNPAAPAHSVSLGTDGLSLYFTPVNPNGSNGVQITTRPSLDAAFAGTSNVSGVPGWSYSPFATADGALLFSQYPESSAATILRGTVVGANLSGVSPLFGAGNNNDVDYPTLSSDGTELFYTEYVPGDVVFRRAVRAGTSYVPTPMAGLDQTLHEVTWVSADACRVYVTDWRAYTLQVAQRLP